MATQDSGTKEGLVAKMRKSKDQMDADRNNPEKNIARVRNIGVIAHVDSGKTTMTEAMLYNAGSTHKRGSVDDGTTTTDSSPDEQKRGITISSACVTFTHEVSADKVPHLKD